MEIPRCESVVLSLSWGFLQLAECLWDVSLCLCHGLVLFPQHILVTCLHGYLPESAWLFLFPRRPGTYRSWLLKQFTAGFICLQGASYRHTVSMLMCIDLMWKFNIRFDPSVIGHKKGCWKQQGSYKEHLVWIFPCFAVNESFLSLPFHCSHYSSSDCWEKSSLGDGPEYVFMYLIWLARDRGKMDCVSFINWLPSCPLQV